jgi:hypothetical protein
MGGGKRRTRSGKKEAERGVTYAVSTYHAVLPVNRETASFRGINGRHPAKTRVPAIYSTVSPSLG